jgi:glycosyltransferase involved in cell wall biosynthesis
MDYSTGTDRLAVDVVVPCFNEHETLAAHVRRLHAYLDDTFDVPWQITIADNASTDETGRIAADLSIELRRVVAVHVPAAR